MVSDGVRQKEKIIYFEDSCLPMKLLVTHAIQLKEKWIVFSSRDWSAYINLHYVS